MVQIRQLWAGPCRRRGVREFFVDNLLVRIHFIIMMIRWTGLAPWVFEFPFPGSLTSTFLVSTKACQMPSAPGTWLTDNSQVVVLNLWYTSVNFGAETNPVSSNLTEQISLSDRAKRKMVLIPCQQRRGVAQQFVDGLETDY